MSILLCHIFGCASSLTFVISSPYSPLILRSTFAYPSSHTRLRQLADFPSLKVRWEEL